jgi:hypothetical protein
MGFGAPSSSPIVHVPRKAARGREASAAPGGVALSHAREGVRLRCHRVTVVAAVALSSSCPRLLFEEIGGGGKRKGKNALATFAIVILLLHTIFVGLRGRRLLFASECDLYHPLGFITRGS